MSELTARMRTAALLLAQGLSINKTAEQIGVNEKTIDKWKRDKPEFNAEIKRCGNLIYNEALEYAITHAKEATRYFASVMRNEEESTQNRMKAAKQLLDLSGISVNNDLEERVKALEEENFA